MLQVATENSSFQIQEYCFTSQPIRCLLRGVESGASVPLELFTFYDYAVSLANANTQLPGESCY